MAITTTFRYQIDPQQGGESIILKQPLSSLDSRAHVFTIVLMNGEAAANLADTTCTGWFIRSDGVTVPLEGVISGNTVTFTLAPNCYTVPGRFKLSVKLESSSVIHTLLRVQGYVEVSRTDSLTSAGSAVSSFDALIAEVSAISKRDRVFNLLDNSDFTAPVNQRSWLNKTQVAKSSYFLDRWMAATGNTITPTLSSHGLTADGEFFQLIPKSGLVGKTLTAAVGLSDGTVLAKKGVVPADGTWSNFINTSVNGTNLLLTNSSEDMLRFRIFCNGNTVRWAALYEGEYTRTTLPPYQPKGYAAELIECMRYFRKIQGTGRATGFCTTSAAYMGLPLTIPMRIPPTLTVTDYGTLRVNGNNITPTGASISAATNDSLNIQLAFSTTSGIANHVGVWTSPVFTLSADYAL
ncbi:MAG: hypothetical protein E7316_04640 [Clostridiales bacterium]|nr:hypothetical protein [Clostridiales bacterium]